VEGAYDGTDFQGDRIIVRHDENYAERNPGRIEGYDERGACSVAAST
jgi:cytochrome c-type biogenesis protein CcmE